jgi:hypothetical protein
MAEGAKTAFMPQCGLAPGFIGIVAHHLASSFDEVRDVQMRVGALPAFPTNALKYNLTWSVDGLINEYCHPCEAIHDGETIAALPLEGLEHFAGRHRVRGLQHLRRPGHAVRDLGGQGAQPRLQDGALPRPPRPDAVPAWAPGLNDQEKLKDIMRKSMPATMQDVVLVFVTVSGMKNGVLMQEVFARKIFATRDGASRCRPSRSHRRRHLRRRGPVPRGQAAAEGLHPPGRSRCPTSWPTASARPISSRARSSRSPEDAGHEATSPLRSGRPGRPPP